MADLLRRLRRWLWPDHPDALAALDGGPGPEPVPPWEEMRDAMRDRMAATMDIPREWLVAEADPAPLTLADVEAMRERHGRPLWLADRPMADAAGAARRWPT